MYIIKGLIALYDICGITGIPGTGKSAIGPLIAYHNALGDPIFGLRVKPGPVLYVAAEDPHGMVNRVAALRKRFPNAPDFRLVIGVPDLLADGPDRKAFIAKIDELRPTTIWIDTLAMAFADIDEIDNKEMNRVVKACRDFTAHGAAVILLCHPAKTEGSKTPRGGGALYGALDVAMYLQEATEDGIIRGRLTKNRNGPCDLDIAFRIEVEELGIDEDGDPITAAIAKPLSKLPEKKVELSKTEREGLNIFHELLGENAEVDEKAWRDACEETRKISNAPLRDSRTKAIGRVLLALTRKGCIENRAGHLVSAQRVIIDDTFSIC